MLQPCATEVIFNSSGAACGTTPKYPSDQRISVDISGIFKILLEFIRDSSSIHLANLPQRDPKGNPFED